LKPARGFCATSFLSLKDFFREFCAIAIDKNGDKISFCLG